MRPYQWDPAPKHRPPSFWEGVKETAAVWVPLLMLAIADVIGL
jgi:hypothetical protein